MRSLVLTLRALIFPILLGSCLLCVMVAVVAFLLTPEGLNPVEAVSLRLYLMRYNDELNTPLGRETADRRFEVEANDTAQTVGIKLVTQGFIANGSLFARYLRYEGLDTQLNEGTFFIRDSMTIPEIARVLTNPEPIVIRLTIVEGWRLEQIAEAIDANPTMPFTGNDFLALVDEGASLPLDFKQRHGIPDGASLEGFLYPATYEILMDETALGFRNQLLQAFELNVTAQMRQDATASGQSMFEVITLASIIEREAVVPDERPTIADVYLNRLEIDQMLEADPTTQYGLGEAGNWWPQLTTSPRDINHAYNTYVHGGLPPGPIANPGISSIRAAIYPAETPYFFFRATCDGSGRHDFSRTYEEHLGKAC